MTIATTNRMPLATGAVLLLLPPLQARPSIVGVWTDIEGHADIVGEYLANASAIARGAGLRLAVDAQVGCGVRDQHGRPPARSTSK